MHWESCQHRCAAAQPDPQPTNTRHPPIVCCVLLQRHGLGNSALGSVEHGDRVPDWLVKWTSLVGGAERVRVRPVQAAGRMAAGRAVCVGWQFLCLLGFTMLRLRQPPCRRTSAHYSKPPCLGLCLYMPTCSHPLFPSYPAALPPQTCEFIEEEESHLREELLAHPLGIYNEITATAGAHTWLGGAVYCSGGRWMHC